MYTNPKVSASFSLISLLSNLILSQFGFGDAMIEESKLSFDSLVTLQGQALVQSANPDTPVVVAQKWVTVTAYSSTVDQTDSTPFTTALGTDVRDGIVACNFLRFGTRVRFPHLYGDKVFVVEDRMALKNSHKIDIWFSSREDAKQFGVRTLKVEVLEI